MQTFLPSYIHTYIHAAMWNILQNNCIYGLHDVYLYIYIHILLVGCFWTSALFCNFERLPIAECSLHTLLFPHSFQNLQHNQFGVGERKSILSGRLPWLLKHMRYHHQRMQTMATKAELWLQDRNLTLDSQQASREARRPRSSDTSSSTSSPHRTRLAAPAHTWVVVKIMVPVWVP